MALHKSPNRLIKEKSPYLRQHAHNPVDWYPWGEEVFAKAAEEDKPIFLSVGYSTCHWCHVMEKESFEDDEVAGILNGSFLSIKVDREERPDIDSIYMHVCQLMTGRGGIFDHIGSGFHRYSTDSRWFLPHFEKMIYDGAIPSSNSVALLNLLRLSRLTGKSEFETMADKMSEAMAVDVEQHPTAYTFFLSSLDFALGPTFEAVVCGRRHAQDTHKMLERLMTEYLPKRVALFLPDGEKDSTIRKIAPFTANHTSQEGKAAVYVCSDHSCLRPTTDPSEMLKLLKAKAVPIVGESC
jgi:uncharacterized protein YyaL (SSP411 family)